MVIDNSSIGPAIGGIRMTPTVNTEEVFRLARAMTWKNALAGIPHGGGKAGIIADPHQMTIEKKETLIRQFAEVSKVSTNIYRDPTWVPTKRPWHGFVTKSGDQSDLAVCSVEFLWIRWGQPDMAWPFVLKRLRNLSMLI